MLFRETVVPHALNHVGAVLVGLLRLLALLLDGGAELGNDRPSVADIEEAANFPLLGERAGDKRKLFFDGGKLDHFHGVGGFRGNHLAKGGLHVGAVVTVENLVRAVDGNIEDGHDLGLVGLVGLMSRRILLQLLLGHGRKIHALSGGFLEVVKADRLHGLIVIGGEGFDGLGDSFGVVDLPSGNKGVDLARVKIQAVHSKVLYILIAVQLVGLFKGNLAQDNRRFTVERFDGGGGGIAGFGEIGLGAMGAGGGMDNLLGEVVSRAGIKQLRLAETQKFRHVTSFFNGKSTTPSEGEDQVEVKSRFDPATFASHPEMDAYNVTDELLKRLENNPYGFIVVNYANCDMVGHTGDPKAASKAVEVVDECIGKILPRLMELDAHVLIYADHGNAEQMVDYKTGMVKTSHTLNLVDCFYVANDAAGVRLTPLAKLSAVAPTALQMLGLPVPPEMTTPSLLAGKEPWSKTALNI